MIYFINVSYIVVHQSREINYTLFYIAQKKVIPRIDVNGYRFEGTKMSYFLVILAQTVARSVSAKDFAWKDVWSFYSKRRKEGRKDGNVIFNDALNTFYLRLYGVRHMVKDHSDSERGNPLPPHRLLFSINSKGSFICTIPQTGYRIARPLLHQSWSTGWNEK